MYSARLVTKRHERLSRFCWLLYCYLEKTVIPVNGSYVGLVCGAHLQDSYRSLVVINRTYDWWREGAQLSKERRGTGREGSNIRPLYFDEVELELRFFIVSTSPFAIEALSTSKLHLYKDFIENELHTLPPTPTTSSISHPMSVHYMSNDIPPFRDPLVKITSLVFPLLFFPFKLPSIIYFNRRFMEKWNIRKLIMKFLLRIHFFFFFAYFILEDPCSQKGTVLSVWF